MQYKLPRWAKGAKITAEQLNQFSRAIERIANLGADASSGLQIQETGNQRLLSAVKQRVGAYAKVSSGIISAANGTTLGYGLIDLHYKDGNGVLQPYGGPSEDCYSIVTSSIPAGKIIVVEWVEDDWCVIVEDCGQ